MYAHKKEAPVREHQGLLKQQKANKNSLITIVPTSKKLGKLFYPYTRAIREEIALHGVKGANRDVLDCLLLRDIYGNGVELDVETIMRECNCSQSTYYSAIAKLENWGFIEVYGPRHSRSYRNLWGVNFIRELLGEEEEPSFGKAQEPPEAPNSEVLESNSEVSENDYISKRSFLKKDPPSPPERKPSSKQQGRQERDVASPRPVEKTKEVPPGPWLRSDRSNLENYEEFIDFYKWVLSGAENFKEIKFPKAFTRSLIREYGQYPELVDTDPYWVAFTTQSPFPGEKEESLPEWCAPDGRPHEKLFNYVYEACMGKEGHSVHALVKAQKLLDDERTAALIWEDFKRKIVAVKEQAEKSIELGASPYLPPWMGEAKKPTTKEAAEAIKFLFDQQTALPPVPEEPKVLPESEEISPEQKQQLQESIGKLTGLPMQFQQAIQDLAAQQQSGKFQPRSRRPERKTSAEQLWETEFQLRFDQNLKLLFGDVELFKGLAQKWFKEHLIPEPASPEAVDEAFHLAYRQTWLNPPLCNSFTDRLKHQACFWFAEREN